MLFISFFCSNVYLLYFIDFIADLYIKARAAVRGFVAEGSAYETEKETGRGKRKRVRNKLFEDTDSDEEIINRSKKSIPAPPSVPFKRVSVRKEIKKTENKLDNCLFPVTFFPPSKVSYIFVTLNLI